MIYFYLTKYKKYYCILQTNNNNNNNYNFNNNTVATFDTFSMAIIVILY